MCFMFETVNNKLIYFVTVAIIFFRLPSCIQGVEENIWTKER
jgi:hypothetical protein